MRDRIGAIGRLSYGRLIIRWDPSFTSTCSTASSTQLVVVSTAITAVAFAFVRFLRLGDKPPGEAARVLAAAEN